MKIIFGKKDHTKTFCFGFWINANAPWASDGHTFMGNRFWTLGFDYGLRTVYFLFDKWKCFDKGQWV